jgi:Mrp family chromosome partitioning ATPase
MGKVLDVLRQAEAKCDGAAVAPPAGEPAKDDLVSDFGGEDVPFIEVGPARSLEGSAAVLALRPSRLRIAPQPPADAGPILDTSPASAVAGPVGVCLRPLPDGLTLLPPGQRFAPELIAFHQPEHPAVAEYRQLARVLLDGTVPGPARVLLCAGVGPGAGVTSVVLNLAVCLAGRGGPRVLVVDADESRPTIAERLGLRGRPGLAELLAGSESLDRVLQETGLTNLTALTAGRADGDRPRGAAGDAFRPVLRQLRDRFDVVLIDGGAGAAALPGPCDAVYLVAPQAAADAPATAELVRTLLRQGVPLRGCIVTGR